MKEGLGKPWVSQEFDSKASCRGHVECPSIVRGREGVGFVKGLGNIYLSSGRAGVFSQ